MKPSFVTFIGVFQLFDSVGKACTCNAEVCLAFEVV